MTSHREFYYMPYADEIHIHNVQTSCLVGRIQIKVPEDYQILAADGDTIGVVNNLANALDVVMTYCERHSRWRRDSLTDYFKSTLFGLVQLKQDETGSWYACRDGDQQLMRGDDAATFATLEEAKRAADLHVRDPLNGGPSSDGLSWDPTFQIKRIARRHPCWGNFVAAAVALETQNCSAGRDQEAA